MRKVILPLLVIGLVLLGISFYLHSIDHPKTIVVTKFPQILTSNSSINSTLPFPPFLTPIIADNITIFTGNITKTSHIIIIIFAHNITETKHIPPPQYASLWPETLNAGTVLLLILALLLWRNSRYHK